MIETSPRFLACLPYTLREEGGYSNDAHDPGGMTMEGIIQREYDKYRKAHNLPTQWVKKISDDELHDIYFNEYWLPHCQQLPAGMDMQFFDNAVNEGTHASIVLMQRALQISSDGVWGSQTQDALPQGRDAIRTAVIRYGQARQTYYRSLRGFRYFGADWLRRTDNIINASLKMIDGEASA